ncbi:MAG: Asp23/Gls24 family envelope stress response protein [Chloroflexota bacterium]|nr:Asp23/Gls24 family envelope stress response protein [Chloroflexota bacterium]
MKRNKDSHFEIDRNKDKTDYSIEQESDITSPLNDLVVAEEKNTPMSQRRTEERFHEQEMVFKLAELESNAQYIIGGHTNITDEVIAAIAATAAREVEGVNNVGTSSLRQTITGVFGGSHKSSRGAMVEQGKREVFVDLTIQVIYGFSIPKIVIDVRKKVAARLLEMAGLIAKEINVNITRAEFPDRKPGNLA